ncbi:MAG: MFS transporter [Nocardiaceae bacterium]|nr:MFS transporter [Nocardiaceae bacterium]
MTTLTATSPRRELSLYPAPRQRAWYLLIASAVTVMTFYQTYVQGAVSTAIMRDFGMPLHVLVLASIAGNAVGAAGAWATGIADRIGRANLIVIGSLVASVLALVALPQAPNAGTYIFWYTAISLVAGVVLVATPTLVRDFSPQLDRATAMSIWTLGPVLGSLAISVVTHLTADSHPSWQFQYRLAGAAGIVVAIVAAVGLRELSPGLRNQILQSSADIATVENNAAAASAAGNVKSSPWRLALVLPALGITAFLVFYITRVGFLVLYFVTNFPDFTLSRANGLATWYWAANAIALVGTGILADRLRVRRPFMVGGAITSIVALVAFAGAATAQPAPSYWTFVAMLVLLAIGGAATNCGFITLYSETAERINPAGVARGMSVYGSVLRAGAVVTLVWFMVVVTAPTTLVDHGGEVVRISKTHAVAIATLGKLSPQTAAQLRVTPNAPDVRIVATAELTKIDAATVRKSITGDGPGPIPTSAQYDEIQRAGTALTQAASMPAADLAYLARHGEDVAAASKNSRDQWRTWWYVCLACQILFIPLTWQLRDNRTLRRSPRA